MGGWVGMDAWMDEWVGGWRDGCVGGWGDEDGRLDEDGWRGGGWVDVWVDREMGMGGWVGG